MTYSRRRLLRLLSSIFAAPILAQETLRPKLIVRSARPEDFEMPLDGFLSWITPVERFFVRTHLYNPTIDARPHRVAVGGLVHTPLSLDLAEIKRLPRVEQVSVLECAGNGRSFFEPTVIGMQWQYGGVGNGRWAGVRLADVLRKAGLKPEAKHIAFNGADVPIGTMPDFVRSIPLEKCMHPDTLLAYELNGEPLTLSHGFPLRVIAPGWAGDSCVKWVTSIQALEAEAEGFFMRTAYRRPVRPIAPGAAVDPADTTPVTSLRPKSVIAQPAAGDHVDPGPVTLRGAAWAGESPVARVDYSWDSGRTWHAARLGKDQSRYGWRLWEGTTPALPRGSHVLMARATDQRGDSQPLVQDWNPSGYLWNVVQQVRIEADAARPGQRRAASPPGPPFPPKVKAACIGCHGEDIIAGQRLTRAQWDREVAKMQSWGASVKPEDRQALIDFLYSAFGSRR